MKDKNNKEYEINFEVDDEGNITFTGHIDTKATRTKPVHQIWSAMHSATKQLTDAWEKHYE